MSDATFRLRDRARQRRPDANRRIGVRVDLAAEAREIGRPAERDEHFSGDDRAATEQFSRRSTLSGRTLSSNHREAERHQDRGCDRRDNG